MIYKQLALHSFRPGRATLLLQRLGILVCALFLSACQPKTVVIEKEVTRIVIEEKVIKQTVEIESEITKVVKEIVKIAVTPTSTPVPQGGILRLTSTQDIQTLNPLFSTDSASEEIQGYIWSKPFEIEPWTGETRPGLVERWELGDENHIVTYHVRRGARWSDGEPITARDFKFMFDALMAVDESGNPILSDSPHLDLVDHMDAVELVDDYTVQVTFTTPVCANWDSLNLAWLPSHVFLSDPDFDWSDLLDHEFNWKPVVSSGPFTLDEWAQDEHITLVRNPIYWKGAPYLDGVTWQIVADATVETEMLKTSQSDLGSIEPDFLTEIERVPTVDIFKFLLPEYTYLALQQGDPESPQPRLVRGGTVNEGHGSHPILNKKEVRQALAHAIDRVSIINKALMGHGVPLHTHPVPIYRWAYHDGLDPRGYDPERARQMLEATGWIDEDGDGVRECHDCGTTEDGTMMVLNLRAHLDNEVHENIGILIREQLGHVGVKIEFDPLKWVAYQDKLFSQNFDMAIAGWSNVTPESGMFFSAREDVPGNGFNWVSFYQPDYEQLELQARTVDGCAYEDRGTIYEQIQGILYDEQPYVWLYVPRTITIINKRLGNVNPGPWSVTHNIQEWYIKPE
jgi:peptide/nickel transport system substrate-binding protein